MGSNCEIQVSAELIDLAMRELRSAREQTTIPIELDYRLGKAAANAARAVVTAINAGVTGFFPNCRELLVKLPGVRSEIEHGGEHPEVKITFGIEFREDGFIDEESGRKLWQDFLCPLIRKHSTKLLTPDAVPFEGLLGEPLPGTTDRAKYKFDRFGRVLGRDGKPREIIETENGGRKAIGKPGLETDHMSDAQKMELLRRIADGWVDVCEVAKEIIITAISSELISHDKPALMSTASDFPTQDLQLEYGLDFCWVRCNGIEYAFSFSQRACIKFMIEQYESGSNKHHESTILEEAGLTAARRLSTIFKSGKHPAWKTFIRSFGKGVFGLADPNS